MYRYRVAYSYTSNVTGKTERSVRKVEVPYNNLQQKARDAIAEALRQSHFGPTVEGGGVVVLSECVGLFQGGKDVTWRAPIESDGVSVGEYKVPSESEHEESEQIASATKKESVKKVPKKKLVRKKSDTKGGASKKSPGW